MGAESCDLRIYEELVIVSAEEASHIWSYVEVNEVVVRLSADGDECGEGDFQ